MKVVKAIYNKDNESVQVNDNWCVPIDPDNREYKLLMEWVAEGNVIEPYVAPPPPSKAERSDYLIPDNDFAKVSAKLMFELVNKIRVLEGQPEINAAQFKEYLKNKLD